MESPNIVVAGASGYIGSALIPKLLEKFPDAKIIALSRSPLALQDARVTTAPCDLFSLKSLEAAMPSTVDLAIYLVHSMGPTAHLDQGSFADYDLLLADNFARSLKKTGIKQLIYLGGLIPQDEDVSLHLKSRLEVEETFEQYPFNATAFRAGLIVGEGGSSTNIMLKLIERLPAMICPAWTRTLTHPVTLEIVLDSIVEAALQPSTYNRVFDLAGSEPITYLDMMKQTAEAMGLPKIFIPAPVFSPYLSRLWVSLVTNTPRTLVYPLIESLKHPMVARESHLFSTKWKGVTYRDLLKSVSLKSKPKGSIFRFHPPGKSVRSVQRLPLPEGKDALWVKDRYVGWLPKYFFLFIRARIEGPVVVFSFLGLVDLLELNFSVDRSDPDRQLLYVTKGFLVSKENKGRLEFRVVLGRRFVLAAIHEYRPALPWFIYKFTQAKVHLMVMRAFARRLGFRKPLTPVNS